MVLLTLYSWLWRLDFPPCHEIPITELAKLFSHLKSEAISLACCFKRVLDFMDLWENLTLGCCYIASKNEGLMYRLYFSKIKVSRASPACVACSGITDFFRSGVLSFLNFPCKSFMVCVAFIEIRRSMLFRRLNFNLGSDGSLPKTFS